LWGDVREGDPLLRLLLLHRRGQAFSGVRLNTQRALQRPLRSDAALTHRESAMRAQSASTRGQRCFAGGALHEQSDVEEL
jgi:hypothetical protein